MEDKQTDLSFEEERELTPEEEQLIHDYVMNSCTEDEKPVGELIVKWLFSKNPFEGYLKMDFLKFAKEGRKITCEEMDHMIWWD